METRRRRRGGKSAQAVASDPPVRPPSPASESAVESGEESEAELADLGATGVRDRDPPATTLPGDAYQTSPAGAGAGTEGAHAEAPPSPVSLAQGGLATPGDGLSGPDVVGVDPAEAIATAEAQAHRVHRQIKCQAIHGWNSLIPLRLPVLMHWYSQKLNLIHGLNRKLLQIKR